MPAAGAPQTVFCEQQGVRMSDPTQSEAAAPGLRGEAAYARHCNDVADRNAAASRAAKARREEFDRARVARRLNTEAVETARFIAASDHK